MRQRMSCVALVVLALGAARPASPAEISAFLVGAKPGETWKEGYGGMLTITLFNIVSGEIEGAWEDGEVEGTSIGTAAAKAYLSPSIGRLVPFIGLGVGGYRESLPTKTDQGTNGLVFAGVKLKFPFGLVVRGEYQWVQMPDDVLLPLDNRYLFSAGLSF
jgi:hypothetical protein